jgi:hypothetical protein
LASAGSWWSTGRERGRRRSSGRDRDRDRDRHKDRDEDYDRIERICLCIGRNQEPHEERMYRDRNGRRRSGQGLRFDVDGIRTRSALCSVV